MRIHCVFIKTSNKSLKAILILLRRSKERIVRWKPSFHLREWVRKWFIKHFWIENCKDSTLTPEPRDLSWFIKKNTTFLSRKIEYKSKRETNSETLELRIYFNVFCIKRWEQKVIYLESQWSYNAVSYIESIWLIITYESNVR